VANNFAAKKRKKNETIRAEIHIKHAQCGGGKYRYIKDDIKRNGGTGTSQ